MLFTDVPIYKSREPPRQRGRTWKCLKRAGIRERVNVQGEEWHQHPQKRNMCVPTCRLGWVKFASVVIHCAAAAASQVQHLAWHDMINMHDIPTQWDAARGERRKKKKKKKIWE